MLTMTNVEIFYGFNKLVNCKTNTPFLSHPIIWQILPVGCDKIFIYSMDIYM